MSAMRRFLAVVGAVAWVAGCGDPARFRPAKGVKSYPSTADAYRVQEPQIGCDELGFVIQAERIEDIATTAANHGGTHYQILDDFSATSIETTGASQAIGGGLTVGRSSSFAVKHHAFTARVYRC